MAGKFSSGQPNRWPPPCPQGTQGIQGVPPWMRQWVMQELADVMSENVVVGLVYVAAIVAIFVCLFLDSE